MNKQLRADKRIILSFIRQYWSDQRLAEVYAFWQDGKMSYGDTCGCLLGVTGSIHLHNQETQRCFTGHYWKTEKLRGAIKAESAFCQLWECTPDGRQIFGRLLRAEMRLRAWQRRRTQAEIASEVAYA